MLNIDHVLVPVDFSNHSQSAFAHAAAFAEQHGATLHVLHIVEEPAFPSFYEKGAHRVYGEPPDLKAEAQKRLDAFVEGRAAVPIITHVTTGRVGSGIVTFAANESIDVVIIASKGLSGVKRAVLGSVAEEVVRHAPCAVFVLKGTGRSLLRKSNTDTKPSPGDG